MRLFIGYDPFETDAYKVCRLSFRKHHPDWQIARLDLDLLKVSGVFDRPYEYQGPGYFDMVEERPFSSAFAFSRFLVPYLCGFEGYAAFCDSDFLWRGYIGANPEYFNGPEKALDKYMPYDAAVGVVQHDYHPSDGEKIRGQSQVDYPRKNWSSMIVWNCAHPANRCLTPEFVSRKSGRFLHGFRWLDDDDILGFPDSFNWLEGHSKSEDPVAVHYTRGVPPRLIDADPGAVVPFADEWFSYTRDLVAA